MNKRNYRPFVMARDQSAVKTPGVQHAISLDKLTSHTWERHAGGWPNLSYHETGHTGQTGDIPWYIALSTGCILTFHPGFWGFQGRVLGVLGLFQGFSTRILANFRVLPQPIISAFLDRIPHFHVSRPPNPLSSSFLDHLAWIWGISTSQHHV